MAAFSKNSELRNVFSLKLTELASPEYAEKECERYREREREREFVPYQNARLFLLHAGREESFHILLIKPHSLSTAKICLNDIEDKRTIC